MPGAPAGPRRSSEGPPDPSAAGSRAGRGSATNECASPARGGYGPASASEFHPHSEASPGTDARAPYLASAPGAGGR